MDDGDDQIYKERMARLEAVEKRLRSGHETADEEEDELEDLESRGDNEKDDEDDDNRPKFEHVNCVIDTGEHVELDSSSTYSSSNLKLKVPAMIWSRLYKFQKTGLKWMWELHMQRCGGILGDEMGLGKTVQMIAYLASLSYSRLNIKRTSDHSTGGGSYTGLGPVLIVTPVTVIAQWVREFHEWWPYLRVNVLHDIGTYQQDANSKSKIIEKTFACNGVLITTYSSLLIYDRVRLKDI